MTSLSRILILLANHTKLVKLHIMSILTVSAIVSFGRSITRSVSKKKNDVKFSRKQRIRRLSHSGAVQIHYS